MFATIGRTWNLARLSWRVLMKDKELVLFPILAFLSVAIIIGLFFLAALATGAIDRLGTGLNGDAPAGEESVTIPDIVLYLTTLVLISYAVIFFNAALIAAAIERLRGGDPNVASGLKAVVPHMHNILGWAVISATVGLILQALRSRTDNMLGRIAISLAGGVWAYMTFFVVPILVVRGVSPFRAIKDSASLFKRTWGEQVTSNFGFGLFYILASLIAIIPAAVLFAIHPIAGLVVGIPLVALAVGAVQATEGIFKAALFEYAAEGLTPEGFESADLGASYARSGAAGSRGFI